MNPAAVLLRLVIRCYALFLSPVLPPSCRYFPTCSEYAQEAVTRHGALRGGVLTLRRILRCHPWGGWGYDPVPPCENKCTDDHAHGALHRPERT